VRSLFSGEKDAAGHNVGDDGRIVGYVTTGKGKN
jgi:hypothetical protein